MTECQAFGETFDFLFQNGLRQPRVPIIILVLTIAQIRKRIKGLKILLRSHFCIGEILETHIRQRLAMFWQCVMSLNKRRFSTVKVTVRTERESKLFVRSITLQCRNIRIRSKTLFMNIWCDMTGSKVIWSKRKSQVKQCGRFCLGLNVVIERH